MNLCFFSGNIIGKLDFKFIMSRKLTFKECRHTSICRFKIKLENGTIIAVKVYDQMADVCYRKLQTGCDVTVYGRINDKFEIEAFETIGDRFKLAKKPI